MLPSSQACAAASSLWTASARRRNCGTAAAAGPPPLCHRARRRPLRPVPRRRAPPAAAARCARLRFLLPQTPLRAARAAPLSAAVAFGCTVSCMRVQCLWANPNGPGPGLRQRLGPGAGYAPWPTCCWACPGLQGLQGLPRPQDHDHSMMRDCEQRSEGFPFSGAVRRWRGACPSQRRTPYYMGDLFD